MLRLLVCFFLFISCTSANKQKHHHKHKNRNQKYLSSELDVNHYQKLFEGTSRDVSENRQTIIQAANIETGQSVADIGAGTGLFLPLMNKKVGPKGKVYAVEIAPNFVKHLKERKKKENLSSVEVIHGTLKSTKLKDNSVDIAFVCDTYHHFDHPQVMLKDIKRALKPGGKLIIVEFDRVKGKSRDWVLKHIRSDKSDFVSEITRSGFQFDRFSKISLKENFMAQFTNLK